MKLYIILRVREERTIAYGGFFRTFAEAKQFLIENNHEKEYIIIEGYIVGLDNVIQNT